MIRLTSLIVAFCSNVTFTVALVPLARSGGRVASLQVSKSEWSAADDWSTLSFDHPTNALPDTADIFNSDLAANAARAMESKEDFAPSEEDVLIAQNVDIVHNHGMFFEPGDPPLYDTSYEEYTKTVSFFDDMGAEISMLVRCNEVPEEMLIEQGRALAPLTDAEKCDVSQLVTKGEDGTYKATDFFRDAVSKIFNEHADRIHGEDIAVLKADGTARWMTKSLGDEEPGSVGPHDRRVQATIAKFGTYGTGYLTEDDFQQLYLEVASGSANQKAKPATHYSMIKKVDQPTLKSVWRDIQNHGIISPAEVERDRMAEKIREEYGAADRSETIARGQDVDSLLDECEIIGWPDTSPASSTPDEKSSASENINGKSSYEHVELAADNKTPKRLRDGQFVFIDEESCIGCTQCAQVAPSSFKMLEDGRARTYYQRNVVDVASAVEACPVSCMHYLSFNELKEMEIARDSAESTEGSEDRRHLNHRQGHTPLHLARRDSDANHKSSWYHYLKNKCFMSKSCPQKGCYDCPHFNAPGENPFFKEAHRKAEHVRALDFIESGEADLWRKTADL